MPLILGKSISLFEADSVGQIDLEQTRPTEGAGVTHLRFSVKR